MKTSPITLAVAAFATLTAFAAPAAMAQEKVTTTVEYNSNELLTPEGVKAVVERIEFKARQACGDHPGRMTITETRAIQACTTSAVENAITKVKGPQLAQALRATLG